MISVVKFWYFATRTREAQTCPVLRSVILFVLHLNSSVQGFVPDCTNGGNVTKYIYWITELKGNFKVPFLL